MLSTYYEIIDSHAHLDDPRFDGDRQDILRRSRSAGVKAIVCVGSDFASSRRAVTLADGEPDIYAAVGVHPHEAARVVPRMWDGLRLLAGSKKVVAWGEIGLDFHYNFSPPDVQKDVFRKQIELALECGLPVIVHDREAHQETMEILKEFSGLKGVVLHCFSGGREMAEECLARGYYLGIGGTLTYPRNERLREIVRDAPIERLLLETDCPYLAPQPWRGKRNEPAYLSAVVEKIAEVKGIAPEDVASATTANARLFFGMLP